MTSAISLRSYIRYIRPQENIACCTACATLLAAEIYMAQSNTSMYLSRLYLYYMTRKLQGRLNQHGAELKSTMEALSLYGSPPEKFWPFQPAHADKEPHIYAAQEAMQYRIQSYMEVSPDSYKTHLNNNTPIIIGIRTGRLFWRLSGELSSHRYKPTNHIDNLPSFGHAVTIIGYDDDLNGGSWIIANSVGPQWGFQGYGAIPYACNIDIGESYIITKFAGK